MFLMSRQMEWKVRVKGQGQGQGQSHGVSHGQGLSLTLSRRQGQSQGAVFMYGSGHHLLFDVKHYIFVLLQ